MVYVILGFGMIIVCSSVEGEWICVDVIDIGSGILVEYFFYIWDNYYIIKLVGEGMGFGLLIVCIIVSEYGGEIFV